MHLCCLWTSFKKVVLPDPLDPTQTVNVMVKQNVTSGWNVQCTWGNVGVDCFSSRIDEKLLKKL